MRFHTCLGIAPSINITREMKGLRANLQRKTWGLLAFALPVDPMEDTDVACMETSCAQATTLQEEPLLAGGLQGLAWCLPSPLPTAYLPLEPFLPSCTPWLTSNGTLMTRRPVGLCAGLSPGAASQNRKTSSSQLPVGP